MLGFKSQIKTFAASHPGRRNCLIQNAASRDLDQDPGYFAKDKALICEIPGWTLSVVSLFIFLAIPYFASAKTISFEKQTWEIADHAAQSLTPDFVRNDFSLIEASKEAMLGWPRAEIRPVLDSQTIRELEKIIEAINQSPKDAHMTIKDNYATDFEVGQNGQAVDLYQLAKLLASDMDSVILPVVISEPAVKLADTNNLGIRELIGLGQSNFTGSPKNRIFNLSVGAKKFNGLIVAPKEEFSFNKYLGEVDGEHGFLPELVIKPEGVTPEFGGGLCQVSSTAFRAAMNAGFPITARRNHSFAVQYYAPQGTDATIYPGSADLKFINDSPASILVKTRIDGKKLFFEYYGTKDDRTVTFEGPNQYDKKPDGSMKAIWIRHVTLNGEIKTQTFKSTYLPPALFHPAPPTPASNPETPPAPNPTLTQ